MSEDCHDSNIVPAEVGIPCHHCGEAVTPEEAYICEFVNPDGTSTPVVFHKGMDRLCVFEWAVPRLEEWAGRMEAIVALFKYVNDGRD